MPTFLALRRHSRRAPTLVGLCAFCFAVPLFAADQPGQGDLTPAPEETLRVSGLREPVEIIRDRWGVNHIYAQNERDLFFAQGYAAARDRLFQFEVWRAQATGTVARMLGPEELERDIGARLFRFRGDMEREMNHYHDRGAEIIRAYVAGVNAYIAETERSPDLLPLEFELLGIRPQPWTPEVVISRHQGLLGNIGAELSYGRAVAAVGSDRVKAIANFHPGDPDIELDSAIDGSLLQADILRLYNAFRRPVVFQRKHLAASGGDPASDWLQSDDGGGLSPEDQGSNNWVVSGRLSQSGYPMMANDPHRAQSVPSLRYLVHLNAPGWDVIGGGEPEIPGVSIGHNGFGAWGLTVFRTDGEDLYVYETDPMDPDRYRYMDRWEEMSIIEEEIPVKGRDPHTARLKYTRHGPVVYQDEERNVAYAVRAAWLEPGGAPYLASLRMNQAMSWEEFVEACSYSNIPGENMVWADRDGNIGWQAVGIAPIRRGWSGLVPVPGDGRYEWDGYLPITAKPSVLNPPEGYFATANNNVTPADYPYRDAIGWEWSDPFRWARAAEELGSGRVHAMSDMAALQTDALSLPARAIVPMLARVEPSDPLARQSLDRLLEWDYRLEAQSVEAGIYVSFERRLQEFVLDLLVSQDERSHLRRMSMTKTLGHLLSPGGEFGDDPITGRDALLARSLEAAVSDLRSKLGSDPQGWRYGQERYKHVTLRHPLSAAAGEEYRDVFTVGPYPRGGNSYTLNNTGGGDNQTSGASFRIIVDTGDWDRTLASNTPGQSGDPRSPYYRNLFELWAQDRYFPLFYSRERVESVAAERETLRPS